METGKRGKREIGYREERTMERERMVKEEREE